MSYLRMLREIHGHSLRDAATKVGIDHGHLSRIERAETEPGPGVVANLLELYGFTEPARIVRTLFLGGWTPPGVATEESTEEQTN